jgi:hypothetical protein
MSDSQYISFYENVIFDKENYIELRNFCSDGKIFSRYFKEPKELIKFILDNRYKLNIYVGINPKKNPGRKDLDTAKLKNIIFDTEMIGKKLELWDKDKNETEYLKKLKHTANFIQEYLKKEYNLDVSAVVTSGRGVHVYVRIDEDILNPLDYKNKYKILYKKMCDYINQKNPYAKEIKTDVMVGNFSRILGSPGSVNIKYPERPLRKILYLNTETNNKLRETLENTKEYRSNTLVYSTKRGSKNGYTEDTIFSSPEFLVFSYHPESGTQINNKLRLALKLLMARDRCFNFNEVSQRIAEFGFPLKEMDFVERDYPDYKYTENILNNYVIDNFEWSVDVGFKLPYELKEEKIIKKQRNLVEENKEIFKVSIIKKITTIKEFIETIGDFNSEYISNQYSNKIIFYTKALEKNLFDNIDNKKLERFILDNNLFQRLKYYISKK